MKKRLNNKGYMLIEIILASVIAMTVAYFLMELTIKLKNKNDDILVKTLTYTDQAIIYNKVMEYLIELDKKSDIAQLTCDTIKEGIKVNGKTVTIGSFSTQVNKYATVGISDSCSGGRYDKTITITIAIKVPQLSDEDFNVDINYIIY